VYLAIANKPASNFSDKASSFASVDVLLVFTIGVVVNDIYYIGSMTLPKQILDALNNKIKAIQDAQRIENEVRSAKAEAEKAVAVAEGQALAMEAVARGNRALAASITPTLIELKRIEKWNGQLPQVQGGSGTFVTLK
jgi:regulator of protease activity HflC (stomatin/prohibitin superfamily)